MAFWLFIVVLGHDFAYFGGPGNMDWAKYSLFKYLDPLGLFGAESWTCNVAGIGGLYLDHSNYFVEGPSGLVY